MIDRGNKNPIFRNSIVANVLAAIDLGDDLETVNDSLDLDEGANDFQNYPEVVSYIGTGDSTFVEGVLSASPFQNYRLEFFADTIGTDVRVDAMAFVGFLDISTDLAGDAEYLFKYKGVPEGVAITATDDFGNTSEFGLALGVIFGPNLTTGIEGDSLATVNDDKETRVTVANQGTDLVESVSLTIEWTDNLSLKSLVNDETDLPVDCPGNPAVCTVGNMEPTDLLRLRATFTGDTEGSFELAATADGVANAVPVSSNRSLLFGSVLVGVDDFASGTRAQLGLPYPNPFASSTSFTYNVNGQVGAELDVYDILGRRVHRVQLNATLGEHAYRWDGADDFGRPVGAGLYFVRLSDVDGQVSRTVVRAQ